MTDDDLAVAERSVLGAILLEPRCLPRVLRFIRPSDMRSGQHEVALTTICQLEAAGEPVDPIVLGHALARSDGSLKKSFGPFIHSLVESTPTAANVEYYAEIIRDAAIMRRLSTAATRIGQLAQSADIDPAVAVLDAHNELDSCIRASASDGDFVARLLSTIESLDSPVGHRPTPWNTLNDKIGGLAPGRLYVIGARPGVGKTMFALQLAAHIARTGTVLFHTLEMSEVEIHHRLLAQMASIPVRRLESGCLSDAENRAISRALPELSQLRLSIDDRSDVSVSDIAANAQQLHQRSPLAAVVVDYLQLMESSRRTDSRQQEVARFSRRLKVLARSLGVPVVALSQLNRGPEHRVDKMPTMTDLRESGAIEQDADVIILLHYDEQAPNRLVLGIPKQRNGPIGALRLGREAQYMRHFDLSSGRRNHTT